MMQNLRQRLEAQTALRNRPGEVCYERPDPVLVAMRHRDERVSLVCALFGYGRADAIVRFLDSLDFSLLDREETAVRDALSRHYYRFQTAEDVIQLFITLKRLKDDSTLEELFTRAYEEQGSVIEGVNALIASMQRLNGYESRGYRFLVGSPVKKTKGASALKRWMMFLRWMVREDAIDMGLWKGVRRSDLIIPLDTHTFAVSRKLGLLKRKTCDLHAAIELTDTLKTFDPEDPVKYDFALYRLGQEKMV